MRFVAISALAVSLSACAVPAPLGRPPYWVAAGAVTAPVGTAAADAADDPAIWRNAADPAGSLIVATDKKAGLYVYGLDGKTRSFVEGGLLNNVDLVDMGAAGVIVVASDRNDLAHAMLQVYRLDTQAARLVLLGKVPGGTGEGYGLCLHRDGERLLAYSALKDGTVQEVAIGLGIPPTGTMLRQFKIPTQIEGCVVDPADGTLYVGEEDAGIWRFAAGASSGELVARVDNQHLVADVEGLALLRIGEQAWLVASSQGDNAYAVFALPAMTPVGRFNVVAGPIAGGTEETDGIELVGGSFGPDYPEGLFVAQDGHNEPQAQNFKLVSWAAIKAALGI
jgi:3-phytase